MQRHLLFNSTLVWGLVASAIVSAHAGAPTKSLFPARPSATDVSNAKIFEEPLIALGEPSPEEAQARVLANGKTEVARFDYDVDGHLIGSDDSQAAPPASRARGAVKSTTSLRKP